MIKSHQKKTGNESLEHYPASPVCGVCTVCKGNPCYYKTIDENGQPLTHCAGYMINVVNLAVEDIPEIKELVRNQDLYWIENFNGIMIT
jgi:hypothetical protein